LSPALELVGLPIATISVAIVMNDEHESLGIWDHWVVFDILAISSELDIEAGEKSQGVQGINSWKVEGYKGPCPPEGEEHTYLFSVYALDTLLELPAGVDSATLASAMDGHIIGSVELNGTYAR
jgi:Raf kinase inhibitor-like YbhB/YbcL family protein